MVNVVRSHATVLLLLVTTAPATVVAQNEIPRKGDDAALARFLQPVPATEPADAIKTFDILDGFRIDLVAHEPMVTDPVAGAFDENGRLYIAELNDYPYRQPDGSPPLGRIRLLEDTDGDGVFDRSDVFASELRWPTGVAVWKQGIFVAATPDIWYLKDTDGDHRADIRRKVFTGFGTEKAQGSLNNLIWGIDQKIYGAGSKNGGSVRGNNGGPRYSVDRRDFCFDPVSGQFEVLSGGAQFGNSFDDWYNRFLCSQGHPAYHVVLPERYLLRNPSLPVPRVVHNLHPEPTPIFRISPLENWRVIRSTRRVTTGYRTADKIGVNHHVLDGAAGSTVYRGSAYPADFNGTLFVGGAQTNLVHRMRMSPDGVTFKVSRADIGTEFLRSSDIWFRPVNFLNAPDGTLYVLDLCREYLEAVHIPYDVARHLDLTSGRDRGRVYRVAPTSFAAIAAPQLGASSSDQLVRRLESRNSWERETAQRLIFERQDRSVAPALRKLLLTSEYPQARLHAMWLLHGLTSLNDADILRAMDDDVPGVREHAVRLAETRIGDSAELAGQVIEMTDDSDPRVRCQVAFSLGELDTRPAIEGLARLARRDSRDSWIQLAILSSVPDTSHLLMLQLLADRKAPRQVSSTLLQKLAEVIGVRGRPDEMIAVLDRVARLQIWQQSIVLGLGRGLARRGKRLDKVTAGITGLPQEMLHDLVHSAIKTATDKTASEGQRLQAIQLLSYQSGAPIMEVLSGLVDNQQPSNVQSAAIEALANFEPTIVSDALLARWKSATPLVRQDMLGALFRHTDSIMSLLDAVDQKIVLANEIDASRRAVLLSHSNGDIRKRASSMFTVPGPRGEVLQRYKHCLSLAGNSSLGSLVYEKNCVSCHRFRDKGNAIGPNLALSMNKPPVELLTHILDPNREVEASFVQYSILDIGGHVFSGMIASETATSLTLMSADYKPATILRSDIEQIVNSGKSLMPEGLEEMISPQQMADLLSFLSDIQYDLGTEAGLVEEPASK